MVRSCLMVLMFLVPAVTLAASETLPGMQRSHLRLLDLDQSGGGCTKDTDCKGDRVCSAGVCVSPQAAANTPTAAPLVPAPANSSNAAPMAPMQPMEPMGPSLADPNRPIDQSFLGIQNQIAELEASKSSLFWPIFLTITGGVGTLIGLNVLVFSSIILGAIIIGIFVIPLVIGIIWLVGNIGSNTKINAQIRDLRMQQRMAPRQSMLPVGTAIDGDLIEVAQF
jgi:hypothetical protein